ncbi:MAG: 50S ribosomal protein L6 [Nanoarchaeota archaeon]
MDNNEKNKIGLYQEIDIPEGIETIIEDKSFTFKHNDKKISRSFIHLIDIKIKENKIVLSSKTKRKKEKKIFFTYIAHIKNMIKGLTEGFNYKLRVSNVHFPMNVVFNKDKREFVIKNFLGEKKDRIIKIIDNVDIKINGEDVIVSSYDIEKAGIVASSIEKGSKVKNFDRRIYQDGIFIIEKPGRTYL